jgi:hypothetical protein
VAGIVLGWSPLLPMALVALGGLYGLQLTVDDAGLDVATPLVAVGLIVTAELAYWSLEEQERAQGEPGESFRRVAYVAALAVVAFAIASLLLALVDVVRTGGLAIDLLGAAAAAAVVLAVVASSARPRTSERAR